MTRIFSNNILNTTLPFSEADSFEMEVKNLEDLPVIHLTKYRQDEGPLTPVHYIIIVLIIYMGGIAVLIMKSVQRDNEVLRYAHYYENFVKRPQFNRPQLLPSYTLRKSAYKSRVDRGSSTPSHVETVTELGSCDVFEQLHQESASSIANTKWNKACDQHLKPPSTIFVKAMPASTQTDPV